MKSKDQRIEQQIAGIDAPMARQARQRSPKPSYVGAVPTRRAILNVPSVQIYLCI